MTENKEEVLRRARETIARVDRLLHEHRNDHQREARSAGAQAWADDVEARKAETERQRRKGKS